MAPRLTSSGVPVRVALMTAGFWRVIRPVVTASWFSVNRVDEASPAGMA